MDCSPPGSSAHGIFQARALEWVAICFSRRSSRPRGWTQVSRSAGRRFTVWAPGEPKLWGDGSSKSVRGGLSVRRRRWRTKDSARVARNSTWRWNSTPRYALALCSCSLLSLTSLTLAQDNRENAHGKRREMKVRGSHGPCPCHRPPCSGPPYSHSQKTSKQTSKVYFPASSGARCGQISGSRL